MSDPSKAEVDFTLGAGKNYPVRWVQPQPDAGYTRVLQLGLLRQIGPFVRFAYQDEVHYYAKSAGTRKALELAEETEQ